MSTKCYNEYTKKRTTLLKTRKVNVMTKKAALELAIATLSTSNENDGTMQTLVKMDAVKTLQKMVAQLSAPRHISDDTKARANAKRKNDTAVARAELVAKVAPVLRKYLASDVTAKELFEQAKAELPDDFSAAKVQNVLLREMAVELVKTEVKGKANTYRLIG